MPVFDNRGSILFFLLFPSTLKHVGRVKVTRVLIPVAPQTAWGLLVQGVSLLSDFTQDGFVSC